MHVKPADRPWWTLLPDESTTGHLRFRLIHLLWSDLRLSYGQ